jgi:hypothetical protein
MRGRTERGFRAPAPAPRGRRGPPRRHQRTLALLAPRHRRRSRGGFRARRWSGDIRSLGSCFAKPRSARFSTRLRRVPPWSGLAWFSGRQSAFWPRCTGAEGSVKQARPTPPATISLAREPSTPPGHWSPGQNRGVAGSSPADPVHALMPLRTVAHGDASWPRDRRTRRRSRSREVRPPSRSRCRTTPGSECLAQARR